MDQVETETRIVAGVECFVVPDAEAMKYFPRPCAKCPIYQDSRCLSSCYTSSQVFIPVDIWLKSKLRSSLK